MISYTIATSIACLAALVVPSLVVPSSVATHHDTARAVSEASYASRLVSDPSGPIVVSPVLIIVPASARVVAPRIDRVWACGPMVALTQGSGAASTCEWVTR